jgi:hypothetical protein
MLFCLRPAYTERSFASSGHSAHEHVFVVIDVLVSHVVYAHQGDKITVHVFDGKKEGLRAHHGKVIDQTRFRLMPSAGIVAPDTRLMDWHYSQAVRMNLRGFSAP